jgi:hypothetical protein
MDTVADIQTALALDLSETLRAHAPVAKAFSAIWKAASRLCALHDYDEKTCMFLNASTLQGAQPAIVVLERGEPDRASWLIIRHWQECSREVGSLEATIPGAAEILNYCDGVLDFMDAEIRFS